MATSKVTKGLSTASPREKKVTMGAAAPAASPEVMSARLPDGVDYAAHNDHRTLMEAEHIKADPVKMNKVRQVAGRKLAAAQGIHAISNISDIKKAGKALRAGKLQDPGADPSSPASRFPSGEMDEDGLSHHRTLEDAEHIKASPARMEAVKKVAAAKYHAAHMVHNSLFGKKEK